MLGDWQSAEGMLLRQSYGRYSEGSESKMEPITTALVVAGLVLKAYDETKPKEIVHVDCPETSQYGPRLRVYRRRNFAEKRRMVVALRENPEDRHALARLKA